MEKLLQWSTAVASRDDTAGAADAEGSEGGRGPEAVAQSLGQVLGAGWDCVRVHNWSQDSFDEELHGEEGTAKCQLLTI